jgi:uncharacterized membrane protein YphA (DoxX/SURF4 family)
MVRNKYVLFFFCLMAGGMFIWAGALKIAEPLEFAQSIRNYRVVGQELAFAVAVVLPWVEVLSGACLIAGLFRRASALLLSLLLAGFIGLVASVVWRGLEVDCGCFGAMSGRADGRLILQDAVFLFFTLNVFLSRENGISLFKPRRDK